MLAALTSPTFCYPALLRPLACMLLCHTIEPVMTILYVTRAAGLIDKLVSRARYETYRAILLRNAMIGAAEMGGSSSSSSASPNTTNPPTPTAPNPNPNPNPNPSLGSASDLTQLVTSELDRIKLTLMNNISRDRGLRAALELLMGLSILYTLCLPLALLFTVVTPMTAYISSRFANAMFAAAKGESAQGLRLTNRAAETIGNIKEVFTFCNQPLELARFSAIQGDLTAAATTSGRAKAQFEASNRAGIYASILSMFSVGGLMVQRGWIRPAQLVSFIGYCWSLNFATQGLLFSYGDLMVVWGAWGRVRFFLAWAGLGLTATGAFAVPVPAGIATPAATAADAADAAFATASVTTTTAADATALTVPTVVDTDPPNPLGRSLRVDFDNASFSYSPHAETATIKGVTLTLLPGTVTALVGPSGSGKSTIASLLCRLYTAPPGAIRVNGQDLHDIPLDAYMRKVSVVRQQPALFTDSVRNNIAYGAAASRAPFSALPPVSLDDVRSAARAANADEFINDLPGGKGYETVLGAEPGMVTLSGGQQQRICIARALIKDAPLLILDESSSALDSATEALVQQSLEKLMKVCV